MFPSLIGKARATEEEEEEQEVPTENTLIESTRTKTRIITREGEEAN